MRSRPDITLYLRPGQPTPGTRFEAEAVLRSRSDTPIDGIEAHLVGTESRFEGTSQAGNVSMPVYGTARHVDLVAHTPKAVLTRGKHSFRFSFDLPKDLPPAYRSRTAHVAYDLTIRVAIPWWPDRTARFVVPVASPLMPARASAPRVLCTDERGPHGTALYAEASLESDDVSLGGVLRGAVSFQNVAHHRIRRVDLALVQLEVARKNPRQVIEGHRFELSLHHDAPEEGQAIPFEVRVPGDASVSFRGAVFEVRWYLEIRAVITLGSDVTLQVPFQVHRGDVAPETAQPLRRVPPVGRKRRALVWAESARRNGLENDAENERMTTTVEGDAPVTLAITLEPRKSGGLALTAALGWPDLGIDLAVTERRWVDAWPRGTVAVEVKGFADRFTARGREAAQVRALLQAETCRWLLGFDEVALGDEGATLVSESTAQSVDELDAFVARAASAARALSSAIAAVPPPEAMAAHVPAWRAFAASVGGHLSVGDMAIRDAVFDDAWIHVGTVWTAAGAPEATIIRVPLAEREGHAESTEPIDLHALDGQTRAVVQSLEAQVVSLAVHDHTLEARLPAPLGDPATLEPVLTGLGHLARRLTGGAARGPYR